MKIELSESSDLAIMVWYNEDQNEPSKPESDLVLLSKDPGARRERMIQLFIEGSGEDVTEDDLSFRLMQEYGDFVVSFGGVHLFFTLVKSVN